MAISVIANPKPLRRGNRWSSPQRRLERLVYRFATMRFPHLYAELRRQGARILVIPAAFTAVTGQAHWEVLLRARAIETQCWVIAVVKLDITHADKRRGHSMVISPWVK